MDVDNLPLGILYYLGDVPEIKDIPLSENFVTIGSALDNKIVFPKDNVSRYHAKISYHHDKEDQFIVMDLNSTNGTYHQGKRIEPFHSYVLKDGDYLQFSQIAFQFKHMRSQSSPSTLAKPSLASKAIVSQDTLTDSISENNSLLRGSGNNIYRLGDRMSQGGMGLLFKAVRLNDDMPVVVKFLPSEEMHDTKNVFRFITEGRTIIQLNHENIVKGLDLYHDLDKCFLVMEYIEGPSVDDILDRDRILPVELATDIVLQISRALAYLEQHKIYHRDIKPANIIWSSDQLAKLVDFGIVKRRNIDLTSAEYVLGTIYYISPEQLSGESLDTSADIYSLGASYYHMITGVIPFYNPHIPIPQAMAQRLDKLPSPASSYNPKISKKINNLLERMMQPRKKARIQSPQELIPNLEKILAECR